MFNDTPEGQTHHYEDGCEPAHERNEPAWVGRFNAGFVQRVHNGWPDYTDSFNILLSDIRGFIAEEIEQAKKEAYATGVRDTGMRCAENEEKARERAVRIIGETMDAMELRTNAEFIACDDLAIRIIKAINTKVSITYYITFGQTHAHRIPNHTLDKDCVLAIEAVDKEEARKMAFELFGPKWSMLYEKEPNMSYFPRGIIHLSAEKDDQLV